MEQNERIVQERRTLITTIKKQRIIAFFVGGVLFAIPLLLGYGLQIKFMINFINHTSFLLYSMIVILLAFMVYLLRANKVIAKMHNQIMMEECDPILLKNILYELCFEGLYNMNAALTNELRYAYLNTLLCLEEYEEAQHIFNDYFNNEKLMNRNPIYLSYRQHMAVYYHDEDAFNKVMSILDSKVKDPRVKKNNEITNYMFYEQYADALTCMEDINDIAIYEVKNTYRKGVCFYALGKKEEANQCFHQVIEKGNTTVYVSQAKQYLANSVSSTTQTRDAAPISSESKGSKAKHKGSILLILLVVLTLFLYIMIKNMNTFEVDETYEDLIIEKDGLYFATQIGSCDEYDHFTIQTYMQKREKIIFGIEMSEYIYTDEFQFVEVTNEKSNDTSKNILYYQTKLNDQAYYYGVIPHEVTKLTYQGQNVSFKSEGFSVETGEKGMLTSFILILDEEEPFYPSKFVSK